MLPGWFYIRGEPSAHYRPKDLEDGETWPPKYWKFALETEGDPKVEAAFTDARRFARVRLVDCAAEDIRNTTPLKENGPDPVIDRDILTEEWLARKMRSKHVPVKALLLDQANISGIGNVRIMSSLLSLVYFALETYLACSCTLQTPQRRLLSSSLLPSRDF
jgi:formamidopyrimidine-DNA glycosylase